MVKKEVHPKWYTSDRVITSLYVGVSYQWVSLDVCSLYTFIPHAGGPQAMAHFLDEDSLLNTQQIEFILQATKFCLGHNYFWFEGDYYF